MSDDQTQPETGHPDGEGFGEPLVELPAVEPTTGPHVVGDDPEPTDIAGVPEPRNLQVDLSNITINVTSGDVEDVLVTTNQRVEDACRKFALRDSVSFACGLAMMPTEQGLIPVISITIAIPSLVLNQKMQGTVVVQDLFLPQEGADQIVSQILENLRQSRMSEMAANAAAAGLGANGVPRV